VILACVSSFVKEIKSRSTLNHPCKMYYGSGTMGLATAGLSLQITQ
jgi:hypothetical protein